MGQKILVIDDQPDNLSVIEAMLEQLLPEVAVFSALSGAQGLLIARHEQPDVILLDIVMPEMDGYEVCAALKADAATQPIPILMLTALKTDSASRVKALDLGADAFLAKPIEQMELVAQIKVMLRIKQAEDQLRREKDALEQVVQERTYALQHELTEHKLAEAALREREQNFSALAENANDGILVLTAAGNVVYANKRAAEVSGYSVAELCALNLHELVSVDEYTRLMEKLQQRIAGKPMPTQYEETFTIRKDGAHVPVEATGAWTVWQGQPCDLLNVRDITERKRAEEALAREQNLLRALMDTIPDCIYFKDANSRFLRINKAQADWFGLANPEEATGKADFDFFTGEHAQSAYADEQDVMRTGQPLQGKEEKETWPDGRETWVSSSKAPLCDNTGRIIGTFGISRNITARKREEEELQAYREHLEEVVHARTADLQREVAERQQTAKELQKAKEAADAASRSKSEFLAHMSHELRTPLNAILGYAQILQEDANLTERQRKGLNTIRNSGEHLVQVITEILDLSKIEAGRLELEISDFPLPLFLKQIADIMRIRAEQKGLTFGYECDPGLPFRVRADEQRLRQVLLNLLGNAVKFTDKGRVTFKVETLQGNVSTKEGGDIARIRFQVADSGIGIAAEHLEDIFLPFHQAAGRRYAAQGTGLGLPISRRLIEKMGGTLSVTSTVGEGSVFGFDLQMPVVAADRVSAAPPAQKIIGYQGKRRTVLVIDDEVNARAVLLGLLSPLAFNLIEAENGQEGIEKARAVQPDAILLDLQMPRLDGFEVTQCLRAIETLREAVIIAVSANVFAETRQRAFAIGFNDFLIKPVQFEHLLDRLGTHLRLEWIYANASEQLFAQETLTVNDRHALALLSPEKVATLVRFAQAGHLNGVLSVLTELERETPQALPTVVKLRTFAERYRFDEIIELLE